MLQEITAVKSVSYCISRRLNEASSHPNFYIHGEEECLWLHVPALKGYEIYKEQILLFALLPLAWESAETLRFKAAELHSCGSCEWSDRDVTPTSWYPGWDAVSGTHMFGRQCLLLPGILLSKVQDALSSVPHIREGTWYFRAALVGQDARVPTSPAAWTWQSQSEKWGSLSCCWMKQCWTLFF